MNKWLKLLLITPLAVTSPLTLADHQSNRDNDNGRHQGWSNRDHDNHSRYDDRVRVRDHDRDEVSINLILGGGYYPRYRNFNSFGFGVGLNPYDYPYMGYRDRRPVIIEHNTYIERPATRANVTTYTNRRATGASLLRDINGRCFERYVDGRGNETRTELDPSECNF
jgi:hypothetical protein